MALIDVGSSCFEGPVYTRAFVDGAGQPQKTQEPTCKCIKQLCVQTEALMPVMDGVGRISSLYNQVPFPHFL